MIEKRFKQLTEKGFTYAFIDTKNLDMSYLCDNEHDCENIVKLLNVINDENEQLKEENKFAKLLANHRGEMVSFADSLIQDMDDELTQKMWYQFKEEMYQKWEKKRWIDENE